LLGFTVFKRSALVAVVPNIIDGMLIVAVSSSFVPANFGARAGVLSSLMAASSATLVAPPREVEIRNAEIFFASALIFQLNNLFMFL
jgi:hypothetical protein